MTRNSPLLTVRLARSTATTEPNRFVSSRKARETTKRMLVKATPKDNWQANSWLVMDQEVGYDDFIIRNAAFKGDDHDADTRSRGFDCGSSKCLAVATPPTPSDSAASPQWSTDQRTASMVGQESVS